MSEVRYVMVPYKERCLVIEEGEAACNCQRCQSYANLEVVQKVLEDQERVMADYDALEERLAIVTGDWEILGI